MSDTPHYRGRVVWFSSTLGYGFLERPDGLDVLCRFDAVQNPGYLILAENELVEFDLIEGDLGPCAANVVRIPPVRIRKRDLFAYGLARGRQAGPATAELWRRGSKRAKRFLRNTSFPLTKVCYRNGDFSNSLKASNMDVNEKMHKIVVAIDLSANEDRGAAAFSSFTDAMRLKNNIHNLNFMQVPRDSWVDSHLINVVAKAPHRAIELALRFKRGVVLSLPARIEQDSASFWFYAVDGSELHVSAWWRKPRR